eukprot:CAMPEP_0185697868 /NCGR_PEP_ID=MMETSP1164-20130828/6006_1 /TAXON_ID=1104430 /ORGANISM="Chrysoreinhardia sp, Strain CCMP2950" /LENGTH=242 /DNA_ID=CAMNT_0028364767 /DNA_START=17 /DNA_END=745 /DNA_ORIENTATION=-
MTTAHRPTWTAALHEAADHGNWSTGGGARSMQKPARDMPGHLTMKYRTGPQLPDKGLAVDRAEVEKREATASGRAPLDRLTAETAVEAKPHLLLTAEPADARELRRKYDDRDAEDDDDDSDSDDDESSSDDDDDDSEAADDDALAVQLELEKIKQEREAARLRDEARLRADEAAERDATALSANPLLNQPSGAVKRKWNDDVVFRNQARGAAPKDGSKATKRFVNDTIRNDFHKRFLAKYIQ